jgi:hypothetical protein
MGLFNGLLGFDLFGASQQEAVQQYYQNLEEALYRQQHSQSQIKKDEPGGVIIDGECEDITNKRALPGVDND